MLMIGTEGVSPFQDDTLARRVDEMRRTTTWEDPSYVDLAVKIDFSSLGGPGRELLGGIAMGSTIALETFVTQFVLDLQAALNVSAANRVLVLNTTQGATHFSWRWTSTTVRFRILEGKPPVASVVRELTRQAQVKGSRLFRGNVTAALDARWGVVALDWDASLRLMYSIGVVGKELVRDDQVVLGASRWCDEQEEEEEESAYCEWERYFEEDVSRAVGVSRERVEVLFVRPAAPDSVLAHFRIFPALEAPTVVFAVGRLLAQVGNLTSELYDGNVTVKVDAAWGVSGVGTGRRRLESSKAIPYAAARSNSSLPFLGFGSPLHAYERCKATQRCARGYVHYDQASATSYHTTQMFGGGLHVEAMLWANFEDWRAGTFGWWNLKKRLPLLLLGGVGGGVDPFSIDQIGPRVRTIDPYGWCHERQACRDEWNSGLVLNREQLQAEVALQSALVANVESDLAWVVEHRETALLDADGARARADVKRLMVGREDDIRRKLEHEATVLRNLEASQCRGGVAACSLLFNTSSLELRGAINATGEVVTRDAGQELAVFAFDSISLGSEVNVTLVGQRSLVLSSRSSAYVNASLVARPGTLGGFPGGFSIARLSSDALSDAPRDVPVEADVASTNVNGPGSPSVRVHLRTIETAAAVLPEIQVLNVTAAVGETVGGSFNLRGAARTTRDLSARATSLEVETAISEDLNRRDEASSIFFSAPPGVGRVRATVVPGSNDHSRAWLVTFLTATYEVPVLGVDAKGLTGVGATGSAFRERRGNVIGGTFALRWRDKHLSRSLAVDVDSRDVARAVVEDFPDVVAAASSRSGGRACEDGLCASGPSNAGGRVWALTIVTLADNPTPVAPTDPRAGAKNKLPPELEAVSNATGVDATVTVRRTYGRAVFRDHLAILNRSSSFSLSYGGAGAGHGGRGGGPASGDDGAGVVFRQRSGGRGRQIVNASLEDHFFWPLDDDDDNVVWNDTAAAARTTGGVGAAYGAPEVLELVGGSGGAAGYSHPFVQARLEPGLAVPARGGAGGGAIEIVAVNDIELGPGAQISVDAEPGHSSHLFGGGGGSGGSIVLAAGGVLRVAENSKLSARGGNGGSGLREPGGGGGGGRVAVYATTCRRKPIVDVGGGTCANEDRNGISGSAYFAFDKEDSSFEIEEGGAVGTGRSLAVRSSSSSLIPSGPEYELDPPGRPGRASFYARSDGEGSAMLALKENEDSFLLGVLLTKEKKLVHGSGFRDVAEARDLLLLRENATPHRWYKIDISLDWESHTYDVFVDDILRADDAPLRGNIVRLAGAYVFDSGSARFDEVYLGPDFARRFRCPAATRRGIDRPPPRRLVDAVPATTTTTFHPMTRHDNHASRREVYEHANGGLVPFDGAGHLKEEEFTISKTRETTLNAGALFESSFWYGEHDDDALLGGIGACWTSDLKEWKRQGIVLHYANLTDMVHPRDAWLPGCDGYATPHGTKAGYGCSGSAGLVASRPRVLRGPEELVMWMGVDDANGSLALAGIATASHPSGPFTFRRSFYPDGNETRDQVAWRRPDSSSSSSSSSSSFSSSSSSSGAVLARKYATQVEYVMPAPQMHPVWEMVASSSSSSSSSSTERDFALSYHRGKYQREYDDYHDIYLQRWRLEDKPWLVLCVDRVDPSKNYSVPRGQSTGENGATCPRDHYKLILGQGYSERRGAVGIASRFKDPFDPKNNAWRPNSVPAVRAQPWSANYRDGTCGLHEENYIRLDDADLATTRVPQDRRNCSNVEDNPVHATLPDDRVGILEIVETRRVHYVAASPLTPDFMDTSGLIYAVEGDFDSELDAMMLDSHLDFGGPFPKHSTFEDPLIIGDFDPRVAPIPASRVRYHQYLNRYNDRARYSLACVHDGICPVNFLLEEE
ncbi:hypothetical protein CTAYLR_003143 [Chrysophaeum taylorii]|uniref:Uncharacterized protein n=1 Tax=Chrysophaeum taylorii TaxID=2483200 RepID=A0AAD7UPE6_9STRA|nr:hypothetical protein CTAYLR_003143 [Chrysophaeum taylorii]